MSGNLAQAASSGEAVLLIGGLVVALILLGTALARSAGALAGVAVEAARAGLSAVGGLLAVLALLVVVGYLAVRSGFAPTVPTTPAATLQPQVVVTVPDVGTDTNLLQPVDPDNPGVG